MAAVTTASGNIERCTVQADVLDVRQLDVRDPSAFWT